MCLMEQLKELIHFIHVFMQIELYALLTVIKYLLAYL